MRSSITFLYSVILSSITKKKVKAEGKQGATQRNEMQPVAHLVMLTQGHLLAKVKSPYHEKSWSIMHWLGYEGCRSKAFAYLRCQLLLSSLGHAVLVCAGERVGGEVERMLYLHTSHHVLFISHLDVFIYPVPQRKSALIEQESTQDF